MSDKDEDEAVAKWMGWKLSPLGSEWQRAPGNGRIKWRPGPPPYRTDRALAFDLWERLLSDAHGLWAFTETADGTRFSGNQMIRPSRCVIADTLVAAVFAASVEQAKQETTNAD